MWCLSDDDDNSDDDRTENPILTNEMNKILNVIENCIDSYVMSQIVCH